MRPPLAKFEPRTILTTLGALQWVSGLHRDDIHDRAQGTSMLGAYKWVWNVAAPGADKPCLRFWTREVLWPESTSQFSIDQVIDIILPLNRKTYHTGEVETTILSIGGPLLKDLRAELNGMLAKNSSFFPRAGLVKFLRTRWLGVAHVVPALAGLEGQR